MLRLAPIDEKSGLVAKFKRREQYGLSVVAGTYTSGLYALRQLAHSGLWPAVAVYAAGILGAVFAVGALVIILIKNLDKLPTWVPSVIGLIGGAGIVFSGCAAAGAYAQTVREFAEVAFIVVVALTVLPIPSLVACSRRQGIERGEDDSEIY